MAKKRPHVDMTNTAMPRSQRQLGDFPNAPDLPQEGGGKKIAGTPVQPSGEVRTQRGASGGRSPFPRTPIERGFNPDLGSRRERNPPGGDQTGAVINARASSMPLGPRGSDARSAPGALARPGSELRSAAMDARSSVPVSIQEGMNTRDRFTSLDYGKVRYDNAEVDAGTGTGRRASGTFRGNRRV